MLYIHNQYNSFQSIRSLLCAGSGKYYACVLKAFLWLYNQRCRDVHVFGCCMLLFPHVVVDCLETTPVIFTCIIFKQPQTTTNNPNRNSRYNHQPPKQKFQKKLKNIKNLNKFPYNNDQKYFRLKLRFSGIYLYGIYILQIIIIS